MIIKVLALVFLNIILFAGIVLIRNAITIKRYKRFDYLKERVDMRNLDTGRKVSNASYISQINRIKFLISNEGITLYKSLFFKGWLVGSISKEEIIKLDILGKGLRKYLKIDHLSQKIESPLIISTYKISQEFSNKIG